MQKGSSWRPSNWQEIINEMSKNKTLNVVDFEAGAEAILKSLRETNSLPKVKEIIWGIKEVIWNY